MQREAGNAEPAEEGAADDAALLAAAARGSRNAFARLVERHYAMCFRGAWRMTGGHADSEDIVQEVFLALWNDPGALRAAAALKGYLLRAVTNRAIDRHRRPLGIAIDEIAEPPALADGAPARAHIVNRVDAAIAALPDRQRQALVLTHFEGLGNPAAAAALGISVEAVESLLARARRGLKQLLAGSRAELFDDLQALDERGTA